MKKSVISLILATIMICTLLCGCGEETNKTKETAAKTSETTTTTSAPAETAEPKATSESADGTYTFNHISLTLPEGFKVVEADGAVVAIPTDAETVTDNITFAKGAFDDIDAYNEGVMEEQLANSVPGFTELVSMEKTTISDHDAIVSGYTVNNGVEMKVAQILIFGENYTNAVAFTSVTGTYDGAYDAAINSISVS